MIIIRLFHMVNTNYDSESGTKFISTDLHGGPFFVSERHNLSVLPPNQFYRTQPDSPHINPIVWV
ncbi:unnamed protein product [Escherichia coli]|nr:unnamed protein product [Escherichia coli]